MQRNVKQGNGNCSMRRMALAKLYFHYSSMNAGKSTSLLQPNHNYGERV